MTASLGTLSKFHPPTICRTPTGEALIANGIDAMKRWDGLTASYETAGIPAGGSAMTISSSGVGSITGDYYCYYRFIDDEGIPGNLSTISAVRSASSHAQFDYSNIPATASDSRVTQVQIFRNANGNTSTFYLDATVNLGTTTATSTNSDAALILLTALPITTSEGRLSANRFGVPPSTKSVVIGLHDRMFAMVDVTYNEGHVEVTNGSATVTGKGTAFTSAMAGRYFIVQGDTAKYLISSVNVGAQTLTLSGSYGGTTSTLATYAIAADPDTLGVIYFTEINEPESWPTTQNTLILQEDVPNSDLQTGACPHGNYLYIFKENHTYRLSFTQNPLDDGAVYLVASRGCVNQRCWCYVEDAIYVLDHYGIWAFNGNETQAISIPIQDIFRENKINWGARKWFWCEQDPQEEVVRFFVAINANKYPRDCIAYNYRLNRWWTEEYVWDMGHGCLARVGGQTRFVAGSQHFRTLIPEGTLDGLRDTPLTVRGTVTTGGYIKITDSSATFPTCVGASIGIVAGKGKGQWRRISANTATTVSVSHPWLIRPDTTSQYQIGGVRWKAQFGSFRLPASESNVDREMRVHFKPTTYAATYDTRRYVNHSETPEKWRGFGNTLNLTTYEDNTDDAVTNMKLALDAGTNPGFERVSFGDNLDDWSGGDRSVSLELRGFQGRDAIRLSRISLTGVAEG